MKVTYAKVTNIRPTNQILKKCWTESQNLLMRPRFCQFPLKSSEESSKCVAKTIKMSGKLDQSDKNESQI